MRASGTEQKQCERLLEAIRNVPAARCHVFGIPALARFGPDGMFQTGLKQKHGPEEAVQKLNSEYGAAVRPARDAGTWLAAMDGEAAVRLALSGGLG